MTITDQLITFARVTPPTDALTMMRLSLFDWAACGLAGRAEQERSDFISASLAQGQGPATVFGGGKAPPATAALVNGTLSHALDYDDTHFAHIGHPSVAVLPAVLALAEEVGATMEEVVAAGTIGIEASVLTGLWLGRDHYQIGYHQTATAGAFGATLATARLLGLSDGEMRHALGLCASMASGLKAQFGTMGKPLNAGLAARTGVEATLWAQAGMTAARDGMAGPLGFGDTHHGANENVRPGKGTWHITSISHKFHACCHGLHATLEAIGDLRLDAESVSKLHIRTHPRWMTVCNIPGPKTGLAAKFSFAQTAAMALLGHDTASIAQFTDAITRDNDIRKLRSKVQVTADERLSETQAEVSITRENGAMQRLKHDLMAPMALEARAAKLGAKAVSLVGDATADSLWQAAQGDCLRDLTDQLLRS
ncbi:MmgE/PrpD family protein [Sulfitobacter aestuariivivens]|uniref:MmgE/PrpD family protein n=1 Tax=Sulfitobacter aestuariivivens TaxID=2766981 RepID=A0A927D4N0_9RHOB|nr:MmgE/PrpD family protein [Sulfitobacter aestuariivivens]MBD3663162.1 MmgE/PrpD family protein [Sulfitobacter aestuariivivens]